MWSEIICGLIIYNLFSRFFNDDTVEDEFSESEALFTVANRMETIYNGKAYVGLRIPDTDTGLPQNVDIVLVTKGAVAVISVKNFSGFVSVETDGKWACKGKTDDKVELHPNPLKEVKRQAEIIEEYLQKRGISLPDGVLSCGVVLPNPKFGTVGPNYFPPQVITYEQWKEMKPEPRNIFFGWIKGALSCGKNEMHNSLSQQLNFVLSSSPMWDRLELKNNKHILGDFIQFKGRKEDLKTLGVIKRSRVGKMVVQKISFFGLANSKVHVMYCDRDYRNNGGSWSASDIEWNELTVRSSTEILFHLKDSSSKKFKLPKIVSMSLTP